MLYELLTLLAPAEVNDRRTLFFAKFFVNIASIFAIWPLFSTKNLYEPFAPSNPEGAHPIFNIYHRSHEIYSDTRKKIQLTEKCSVENDRTVN